MRMIKIDEKYVWIEVRAELVVCVRKEEWFAKRSELERKMEEELREWAIENQA